MKVINKSYFVTILMALSFTAQAASVPAISWQLKKSPESPRWKYEPNIKVKPDPLVSNLVAAKQSLAKRDYPGCLKALNRAYLKGKDIRPWIVKTQLECAVLEGKGASPKALDAAIGKLEAQPSWLLFGPWTGDLRSTYLQRLFDQTERYLKFNRRAAWTTINKLQRLKDWMSLEEKAKVFRWAGELAFVEQNLLAAQEFFTQSLSAREQNDLRAKLDSIRQTLLARTQVKSEDQVLVEELTSTNPKLGLTEEERKIYDRMQRAYQTQDYVSAIEDGVELLQKFPGSARSDQASDVILDIYLSLSARKDEKFRNVRESIVKLMAKVDAGRMYRWALNAYVKGNYLDALDLSEKSYLKFGGQSQSTDALLVAGKAALASGEFADARRHFEKLAKEHGGTEAAAEATFRLGLIEYRLGRYAVATGLFERLLALPRSENFEYRGLYWQWRAKQKLSDAAGATSSAQALMAKYPLTYYGLRARFELNSDSPEIPQPTGPIKGELRLLESDRLGWERIQVLLRAGWTDEAAAELNALNVPAGDDEKVLWASLWAECFRYDQTFRILGELLDTNTKMFNSQVLSWLYPKEYVSIVERESKRSGFDEDWLRSVIRQESSFRPEAKSPSNAYGVMQLLIPTAAEVASDLRMRSFKAPDSLLDPAVNIRLGSVYLSRLYRSFKGHLPLALAAYNAGPGRMRRWLEARSDLGNIQDQRSSSPDVEVWIDELPWEETSLYIKAILRNWMIYRWLYTTKVKFTDPIWVDASLPSR